MGTKIIINGREYDSVEAMPAHARRLYEETISGLTPTLPDADGNGVPDLLEGKGPALQRTIVENKIIVNGRVYQNPEQMPADVRRLYEQALSHAGSVGTTFHKGGFHVSFNVGKGETSDASTSSLPESNAPSNLPSAPPPIAPTGSETGIRSLFLLAGLLVGAFVLWLLMRRP